MDHYKQYKLYKNHYLDLKYKISSLKIQLGGKAGEADKANESSKASKDLSKTIFVLHGVPRMGKTYTCNKIKESLGLEIKDVDDFTRHFVTPPMEFVRMLLNKYLEEKNENMPIIFCGASIIYLDKERNRLEKPQEIFDEKEYPDLKIVKMYFNPPIERLYENLVESRMLSGKTKDQATTTN